ncbi:thioredoxin family protein [Thalassobacillus sp. CUG 92003]|uniref:thioredoxin family protein n=1 Tax=Thalassobacillus sp. CUG 92003 TaxID=2736641 RepID=UPI0015E7995F|nr:thioredoxin family protein [Thalassobacillus sp. CUG 92003]
MKLEDYFIKGLTPQEYIDSMETHQQDLVYIYEHFQLPSEDQPFFERLQQRNLRVIVLTEDWCGDAMLNIPILLRLAETGHMNVHMLLRDENEDLMDQYLTNGTSRSIPKFIFLDVDGNEITNWGPRAPEPQAFIDDAMSKLPSDDDDNFKEKRNEMLQFITKAFRDNQDFWYNVYDDLKQTLQPK